MYNNIVRLGSERYMEMLEHFTRILDALYPFSTDHKHIAERSVLRTIKRRVRRHTPGEEEKHRRMEEEERVREEKEFFDAIEKIRDEEDTGIHPRSRQKRS